MPEQGNPSELKPAVVFALLFGVILLATAAAKDYFGSEGLYAVAILSGLADMDAITLSVTQMVQAQSLPTDSGWKLILVASLSNLVFKTLVVAALGDRKVFMRIAGAFGIALTVGVAVLLLWPAAR